MLLYVCNCPPALSRGLSTDAQNERVMGDNNLGKDVITLSRMIRDVAHAHDDTTQGAMAIVTSDMALYTTYMSKS